MRLWDVAGMVSGQYAPANKPTIVNTTTTTTTTTNDDQQQQAEQQEEKPDPLLLKTFYTKRTPVYSLDFTRRNLLIGAGEFQSRK